MDKGKDHQQALTFTCNNFCNFFPTLTQVREDTVLVKAEVRVDKEEVRVDREEVTEDKAEVREVLMAALLTFTHNNRWHSKLHKAEVRVVAKEEVKEAVKEEVKAAVKAEVKEAPKAALMICTLNNSNKCRLDNKEDNMVSNSNNSNNKVVNNNNSNNRAVFNSNSSNNSRVANRGDSKA